ncbi:MAG TPA: four helix bundle protein, partial [Bacteroidales bacterium]|nr:four helix bundle protein [Bacteroidales bacterium]
MESEHDRPATFFRFEDLRVYHKALEYVDWVHIMAKKAKEEPSLRVFFERFLSATLGIPMNIAEGSSRNKSQFVYYLKMAKSSVRECVVLSTIAMSRG